MHNNVSDNRKLYCANSFYYFSCQYWLSLHAKD